MYMPAMSIASYAFKRALTDSLVKFVLFTSAKLQSFMQRIAIRKGRSEFSPFEEWLPAKVDDVMFQYPIS